MAEVKNAFIKSKMNKDLDSRLVPQGEYRDAVNIQVSKSEGDDVGALENVLGNVSRADFETASGVSNLTCIGYFVNEFDNNVYLFFTDYTDPYSTPTPTYNPSANNFIYQCNLSSSPNPTTPLQPTKLVEGAFLNFSTNRPIIGVNVLEEFLFFTDNRNQPRKINVTLANPENLTTPTYYTTEDNISVAKYYPYEPINVYKLSEQANAIATADVNGAVVGSTTITIDNISGNIVEGMAVNGSGVEQGVFVVSFSSPTVTINKEQNINDNVALTFTSYETSMYDASSEFIPLNEGTPGGAPTPPNVNNPYYDQNFPGDPQFLEDKFVRFSYRFKFTDGEYSLIAPFTQPCFIPQQDGYFLEGDEQQTFASTIVGFMENKVNKIDLQIPLPTAADNLSTDFHITEIDIIYKESDGLALQVVETIPIADVTGADPIFEYTYLSQKPYKTLPDNEITRVYDKVPVKALGQEIISNRVVYSNFQDKHTPPSFIKYQVGANEKYLPNDTTPYTQSKTTIEYPNQTLKQNRNYQVGVVLSDRYGRQSTVILSNDQNPSTGTFGADTIYLPYRDVNDSITYLGDSLKLSFNEAIQSNKSEIFLTPGLYNGDSNNAGYNPLGWQTFKIVVKQVEQEYYNVYTAGAMKGSPTDNTINLNTSFVTLINDNINKVPRDLSEVGPQDKTFRSSVRLFGRVNNNDNNFSNIGNEQYISTNERLSFTTNAVEDLFDLFDVADQIQGGKSITDPTNPFYPFFKAESNPFIGEFITSQTIADQFGIVNTKDQQNNYLKIENLAVLETAPTVSRLDLYYETSTSGLIQDLNNAIGSSIPGSATGIGSFSYSQDEGFQIGDAVASGFEFLNFGGVPLNGTANLVSVIDGLGLNRTSEFSLVNIGGTQWELRTNALFYYGADAGTKESYQFTFQFTVGTTTTTLPIQNGNLENIDPTINNSNATPIQLEIGDQSVLPNLSGVNGSADPTRDTLGLTFSIDSSTGAGAYVVVNNNEVQNTDTSASGSGSFTLRLTDAGNPQIGTVTKTFNVIFDEPNTNLGSYTLYPGSGLPIGDGGGAAVYLTSDFTNLTNNIPSSTFGSQSYSNGYNTVFYLRGLEQTMSSSVNPNARSVCDPNNPGSFAPGFPPAFQNIKESSGLTTGAFYVYFNPRISQAYTGGSFPTVGFRYQIAYRSNSSSPWTTAIDMNGQSATFSGTWRFNGSSTPAGLDVNTVSSPFNNTPQMVLVNLANSTADKYGGLVYAFNTPGEYRILHANFTSTFGALTNNPLSFPANGFSCTTPPYVDGDMSHIFETGDFYYPSTSAGGFDDQIAPGSSDPNSVFRYRISQGSCSTTPTQNVYAREPVAKYVTQLYTDQALSTKFTSIASGTIYVIRRMEILNQFGGVFLNPEYTNDGKYEISFTNTTGLVTAGSQTPCYY